MLDKIIKGSLPVALIITIASTVWPNGPLSILNQFSMIVSSVLVYSIGWWISGFVYKKDAEYSLARHIGLAALFAVPILAIVFAPSFLYPYIVGKGFIFRFLSIIAFVSFIYLGFTDDRFRPRITPFVAAFTLFLICMGLSTIFSIDPGRSFWSNYERMDGYINMLALFALLMPATTLRLKELEWAKLFKIHVVVASIISLVGIFQYVIGALSLKGFASLPILSLCLSQGSACRVDSTLGNSIYLGIYAALTFWLIIYAIFVKRAKGNLLPILAGVHLLAVYFSGTRGVWAGMALGLVVLLVSKYWFDGNKKAVAAVIFAGILFVGSFGSFVIYANKNGIAQNLAIVTRFSSTNTLFARWNIWKTSLISWQQKPIIGWGQENFIHAFNLNYNPAMYGQETYFDHPHNTYLGWLVFGGLLGFLAFIFLLLMSIYGVIKSNHHNEEKNDLTIPIILALFTTYFAHIFFVFDNLTSIVLFLLVSVYFGSHFSYGVLNIPQIPEKFKGFFKYGMIVVGILLVNSIVYKPSYANLTTIEAMTYQQRNQGKSPIDILNGTKAMYEKAINMDTLGTYEIREFYLQKSLEFIGLIPQVTDESIKQAIVGVAESAHTSFQTQIKDNPFDHRARFMLGLYYLNIRRYDEAVATLSEALRLAPNKQIALIYLAKAYLLKGDVGNAATYYERAISITPRNIAGYNQIRLEYIQVLMLAGQDAKALPIIRDMIPTVSKEDFNTLVSQMMQVFTNRKDLNGIVKLLNDALVLDPSNENFVLWLAQAYVASGDYNKASFTINKLSTTNPDLVNQFNNQLAGYIEGLKQQAQADADAKAAAIKEAKGKK